MPNSVEAITPLVGRILARHEARHGGFETTALHLCKLAELPWPTENLPEAMGSGDATLRALIHEDLFASLFRACAESLASEDASRLAAMRRAEKNIDEQLDDLNRGFHRLRHGGIDEELFDLVSGFEALTIPK